MLQFIEDWGHLDPWNHRKYLTYLNHVQPAIKALGHYYNESFHVPKKASLEKAKLVIEQVTAAHFILPRDYKPGAGFPFPWNSSHTELRKGIIEGLSKQELVLVRQDKVLNSDAFPLLPISILNPTLLEELVQSGKNVNAQFGWGKTALMAAAHLNRPDAVAVLLKAGADPNLRTSTKKECGIAIERGDRTALMYAAENANIDVIRHLVLEGAKTDAKDSQGNDLAYYLSLNPYLTAAQKKMPIAQLLATIRDNPSSHPTFDYKAAQNWAEKLICRDRMSARLDQEMTTAFAAWKSKSFSQEQAKAEQRAWLVKRSERCRPFEEDDLASACLQRETQARIRYLYNRMSE